MLIVQKFGGTSVGSIERIKSVAQHMLETQCQGHQVVGVVSAMAGETNRLVELALQISSQPWSKEYDMLLASGEQVSVALVALAVNSLGGKARGLLAHQLGILTDRVYSKARIQGIHTELLQKELAQGVIPIVAGFQGVDVENNITTLGRGGSDTSAVALSAALKADDCEIYTDVDGIYTTDPRMCARAQKLKTITYEEMLELSSLGAKVLQIRSVELAAKYKVPLHVRSSFQNIEGTRVVLEANSMEQAIVSGIAVDLNDAKVALTNLTDQPGLAYQIFEPLAQANIVVDVIVQAGQPNLTGGLTISFTIPKIELLRTCKIVESCFRQQFPEMKLSAETNVAKVSIVGAGMRHHPGVAAKMFGVLAKAGINIKLITTSEIRVTVVVDEKDAKIAVEKLHTAFDLDASA